MQEVNVMLQDGSVVIALDRHIMGAPLAHSHTMPILRPLIDTIHGAQVWQRRTAKANLVAHRLPTAVRTVIGVGQDSLVQNDLFPGLLYSLVSLRIDAA